MHPDTMDDIDRHRLEHYAQVLADAETGKISIEEAIASTGSKDVFEMVRLGIEGEQAAAKEAMLRLRREKRMLAKRDAYVRSADAIRASLAT